MGELAHGRCCHEAMCGGLSGGSVTGDMRCGAAEVAEARRCVEQMLQHAGKSEPM